MALLVDHQARHGLPAARRRIRFCRVRDEAFSLENGTDAAQQATSGGGSASCQERSDHRRNGCSGIPVLAQAGQAAIQPQANGVTEGGTGRRACGRARGPLATWMLAVEWQQFTRRLGTEQS